MAFILLKNGRGKVVSAEQGRTIWLVATGEQDGTTEQYEFLKKVDRIFLNAKSADTPASYRLKYPAQRDKTNIAQSARLPYVE